MPTFTQAMSGRVRTHIQSSHSPKPLACEPHPLLWPVWFLCYLRIELCLLLLLGLPPHQAQSKGRHQMPSHTVPLRTRKQVLHTEVCSKVAGLQACFG